MSAMRAVNMENILQYFRFIRCPVKYWTGISCPGCGMTRAWLSLIMLDVKSAWHYHPLFWMPAVIVIMLICRDRINKTLFKGIMTAFLILLLGVYVYRMGWGDASVVGIDFKEGLIYKAYDLLRRI